jgi:hypothetical protein
MAKDHPSARRRTRTLPPEFVTFSSAVTGAPPASGITAHQSEFPDLRIPAPLVLTIDEAGWYRLTVTDRLTGATETGYVRREWAREQGLAQFGVSRAPIDLRRR